MSGHRCRMGASGRPLSLSGLSVLGLHFAVASCYISASRHTLISAAQPSTGLCSPYLCQVPASSQGTVVTVTLGRCWSVPASGVRPLAAAARRGNSPSPHTTPALFTANIALRCFLSHLDFFPSTHPHISNVTVSLLSHQSPDARVGLRKPQQVSSLQCGQWALSRRNECGP